MVRFLRHSSAAFFFSSIFDSQAGSELLTASQNIGLQHYKSCVADDGSIFSLCTNCTYWNTIISMPNNEQAGFFDMLCYGGDVCNNLILIPQK